MFEKSYLQFAPVAALPAFRAAAPRRGHLNTVLHGVGSALAAVGRDAVAQHRRRRARAQLNALDDRLLADIGVRRDDIDFVLDDLATLVGRKWS